MKCELQQGFRCCRRSVLAARLLSVPAQAWEPTKPIEIIVPAGTGGGADQMARVMQGIITKHNLSKQSVVVINQSGGAGGEGFLGAKNAKGDDHKLIITLSNLVHDAARDRHSIQLEGSDSGRDDGARRVHPLGQCRQAVQDGEGLCRPPSRPRPTTPSRWAAPGSKQEDQIITVALEKATGKKMTYIPYKGGGAVAVQLVGDHVDSTVNNPIEAVAHWRAGKLRPLCVFDSKKLDYQRQDRRRYVVERHPDLQVAGPRRRIPDAARLLHAAGRHARTRSPTMSTCSRRCARRPSGRS